MSYYARAIAQDLGCAEDEAARIEVIVRWEHATLNGLSKSRLRREAKLAQRVLAELRAEAASSVEARAMLAQIEVEASAFG
jgi:nucleoid-associated protein YgaU